MGVQDVLSRKSGVIVGEDVRALFKYAQEKQFAIPAINVTSSSTVVAALEAARDSKSPIILQTSQGGAAYFAGKVSKSFAVGLRWATNRSPINAFGMPINVERIGSR